MIAFPVSFHRLCCTQIGKVLFVLTFHVLCLTVLFCFRLPKCFPLLISVFFADVDDIKYVINFDYPNCSEDYVHRIGRTGRRDKKGTAYTFFTSNNAKQANELIDVLKEAKQEISQKLFELSSNSWRYGKNPRRRYGGGGFGGGSRGFGGSSRGFGGSRPSYGNGTSNGFGTKRSFDDDRSDTKRFKPSGFGGSSNGATSRPAYGSSAPTNGYSQDRFNSYS